MPQHIDSTAAGRQIMRPCADTITKISLALGGKASAVVLADADLDLAVECILGGRLANAGQVCNCVERVYVHHTLPEPFIEQMAARMRAVQLGAGLDNPQMEPLISTAARENVHAGVWWVCADRHGARRVLCPNAVDPLPTEMEVMREEVFGPVLPVMTFGSLAEALALANDCKYGLTSTLYTHDYQTVMRFANGIEAGELYVNRQQGDHAG